MSFDVIDFLIWYLSDFNNDNISVRGVERHFFCRIRSFRENASNNPNFINIGDGEKVKSTIIYNDTPCDDRSFIINTPLII